MARRNTFIIPLTFSYDADAAAYFTATGITNTVEKDAINTFVLSLKSYSLWTTFHHLHLLCVGAGATQRKINLVNPVDSDAAFRLSFLGGWTHSTGVGANSQPNGTTGYADSFLLPSTTLSLNSTGFTIDCFTENASTATFMYDCGAYSAFERCEIALGYLNTVYALINTNGVAAIANTISKALYTLSRTASSLTTIYRNGSSIGTNGNVSSVLISDGTVYFGAWNGGVAQYFSNRKYRVYAAHAGWTGTQAANFNTAYITLITALGV